MLIVVLYLCIFLSSFDFTASIMAGAYIVGELGGSTQIASYDVVFFGLGNALTFPLTRFLGKRHGKIDILLTSLSFFFITLILCCLAKTFFLYVLFRFCSGLASGVFFPSGMKLINKLLMYDKQKELAFDGLALLVTITPVIGACLGGWLAYDYHWSWVFLFQLPLLLFIFFILYKNKKKLQEPPEERKLDKVGYLLYILSTTSLVSFACLGQELDWLRSPFLVFVLSFGLIAISFFVLWELSQKHPFLDLRLFKQGYFSLSCFVLSSMYSAYFGMIILLSLWLHLDANYTPIWISFLFLQMLFAGFCLFVFLIKWVKKIPPLIPTLFALFALGASCFYSTLFNVDINFGRLALARIFAGFGLAFSFFPLFILSIRSTPEDKKDDGIALFQSIRLLSSCFGISVYTTMWYRRDIFYHDRLGSTLTLYSNQTKEFFAQVTPLSPSPLASKLLLEEALDKQSKALAFADCFYFMGFVMLFLFLFTLVPVLVSFIRRQRSSLPDKKTI